MKKLLASLLILPLILGLTACGIAADGRNLELKQDGKTVIRVGLDGFTLDGNVTGLSLDGNGLKITYPNGGLNWDSAGLDINTGSGSIRVDGAQIVVTDKDGNKKTLDATGDGAEYRADSGALVQAGAKATLPQDYPADKLALMDGFTLNASADLGNVQVVSGYVKDTTPDKVLEHYRALMLDSDSFHQEKKGGNTVLRARVQDTDFTLFIRASADGHDTNLSIVAGK